MPFYLVQVLGTPTREEISDMNSNYTEFKFPQIKACQWRKVFRSKTPEEAMDFIGSTLAYSPARRVKPLDGCAHPFFDELRDPRTRLPNDTPLPPMFDFTVHEMNSDPELLKKVSYNAYYESSSQPSFGLLTINIHNICTFVSLFLHTSRIYICPRPKDSQQ